MQLEHLGESEACLKKDEKAKDSLWIKAQAEVEKNWEILNEKKEKAREESDRKEEAYSGYDSARFIFIVLLLACSVIFVMTDPQRTSRLQLIQTHLGLPADYKLVEPAAPSNTANSSLGLLTRLRGLQAYPSEYVSASPFEQLEGTLKLIQSITDGLPKIDDASPLTEQLYKLQVTLS